MGILDSVVDLLSFWPRLVVACIFFLIAFIYSFIEFFYAVFFAFIGVFILSFPYLYRLIKGYINKKPEKKEEEVPQLQVDPRLYENTNPMDENADPSLYENVDSRLPENTNRSPP